MTYFVNDTKLVYHRITIIAQGEKPDMENLKQVILELISNNNRRNKMKNTINYTMNLGLNLKP